MNWDAKATDAYGDFVFGTSSSDVSGVLMRLEAKVAGDCGKGTPLYAKISQATFTISMLNVQVLSGGKVHQADLAKLNKLSTAARALAQ